MWIKEVDLMDELEKAHLDYEKRRYEIISKLKVIKVTEISGDLKSKWLDQAIEFIKEKEI